MKEYLDDIKYMICWFYMFEELIGFKRRNWKFINYWGFYYFEEILFIDFINIIVRGDSGNINKRI